MLVFRSLLIPFTSLTFFSYCQQHYIPDYFLGTQLSAGKRFDAIIGNPPFIRYQSFPEAHQRIAFAVMRQLGFHPNRLTNAWVPFLIVCAHLLADDGRLAFVIPAELFQVSYAAEVRRFLSDYFQRITLITFRDLVFADIQQDVIVLLAEKCSTTRGIRVIELNGLDDIKKIHPQSLRGTSKPMDHSTEKWTQYFLQPREIEMLRVLRHHPQILHAGDVMEVDVGIVTGQNDVFLLTEEGADQAAIPANYLVRAVSRSAHLEGMSFAESDWLRNKQRNMPSYLLSIPRNDRHIPQSVQEYVRDAERRGLHLGYKCRTRSPWYTVPSIWVPDGFLLRQIHGYTKLVVNHAHATCTDTLHRVRMKPGFSVESTAVTLLNSMTFAFAEVTGRGYGGGVLTFEPSEAEKLPIPFMESGAQLDGASLDALLRQKGIEAVLEVTDRHLLRHGLGLDKREVLMLRGIWEKLRDRRVNRK